MVSYFSTVRSSATLVVFAVLCAWPWGTAEALDIYPGTNIQSVVATAPYGTQFVLKSGVHRLQTISPRTGDTFIGEPGAVLSGARVLSAFSQQGSAWVATGQTQEGQRVGICKAEFPRCAFPEDVWFDNQVLRHVQSIGEVGHGTWFFDYAQDRIYVGDNPAGHLVETSVAANAFVAADSIVTGVVIRGLVIEKYAAPGNTSAIWAPNGQWWWIGENEVRFNHAGGVSAGGGSTVYGNYVHHNGQAGIGSFGGSYVTIERNEVSYNGEFFFVYWGAGGVKLMMSSNSAVRSNSSHHNHGGGLWCDSDCLNVVFEGNLVEDNEQFGIHYEISFNGIIRNNTLRRNGYGSTEGPGQAGIYVFAAKNVEIYQNLLEYNGWGIVGWQSARGWSNVYGQPYEIENMYVHDNWIVQNGGISGLAQVVNDPSYYTARNNRFQRNWYYLMGGADFYWMDQHLSPNQWRNLGQDVTGTIWP
jgi:parallel beta-helix repeat protein